MQYNLERFIAAQERDFALALSEVEAGKKTSHWMWYIFPQIHGLGQSETAVYYAIQSAYEAVEYLKNSYLKENLLIICRALLALPTDDAKSIFGFIDAMKLHSSMTLFARVGEIFNVGDPVFAAVLEKFFNGEDDMQSLMIIVKDLADNP